MVLFEDFAKLDLRVGEITLVEDHDGARKPMYKLTVNFGAEIGTRTIVAGIKASYSKEELTNKKVVCIVNLDPKTIAGIESQGMLLAAGEDAERISLVTIDRDAEAGSRIH
jgi:tRNA-binding protein